MDKHDKLKKGIKSNKVTIETKDPKDKKENIIIEDRYENENDGYDKYDKEYETNFNYQKVYPVDFVNTEYENLYTQGESIQDQNQEINLKQPNNTVQTIEIDTTNPTEQEFHNTINDRFHSPTHEVTLFVLFFHLFAFFL